jgi:glycosyltransferase involved in cell wall biosynthesis
VSVCLCMIVRDEVGRIERCLDSVLKYVDAAVIVDTGSEDSTYQMAYYTLSKQSDKNGIQFNVLRRPWRDFSSNRNEALAIAYTMGCEHILVMDASDVIEGLDYDTFSLCDYRRNYQIKHTMGNLEWNRPALISTVDKWYYVGKVHELLVRREGDSLAGLDVLEGVQIRCNVGMPFQGKDRFLRDAALLEHETDPRSKFYYAQSLACAGETEAAVEAYKRRLEDLGGCYEERYLSALQVGILTENEDYLVDAYRICRARPEAWFYLAALADKEGDVEAALDYAHISVLRAQSCNRNHLFLDTEIANWKAKALYALLSKDQKMAEEVINTQGAYYPPTLWEIATGSKLDIAQQAQC